MNLLYCGDRGIEDGVIISTLSLCKNLSEPLHVFLLTFNYDNKKHEFRAISPGFRERLENLLKEKNPRSTVALFDVTEFFLACPPTANENSRFTPGCMLRLYADLIPEIPERILYLDNDVVALRDPSDFYNLDMSSHEIAGVLDNYGQHFFGKEYLNSGVLLLNLKKIRETGLFAQAREKCRDEKMFMPDQSALNKLCKTKIFVDRKYNEQAATKSDTVFRHFTTTLKKTPYPHPQTIKPWHISALHDIIKEHSFDDILHEYQSKVKEVKDD